MSSDSEASHSSAQRHDEEEEVGTREADYPTSEDQPPTAGEDANGVAGRDEAEGEELQSIGSGDNRLTFARVRSRGTQQDAEESASELSFRPRVERPDSPESASTPDDTPSIQVRRARSAERNG